METMSQKPSMDELKSSTDDSSSSTDTSNELDEEIVNAPSLNVRPEIGLYFEEIVDIGFTGDVNDVQNLRGEPSSGYGGAVALTLRDPSVGDGMLYASTDEDQSSDYKLVGEQTTKPWEVKGEEVGFKYGQNSFEGEQTDSFEEEYVTLYLNGGLGEYVLTRLDVLGGVGCEGDYDEPVGLMEYAPDDTDYKNAVRRSPILRADMEGESGAILVEVGEDNGAFLGSIFRFDDEGNFDSLEQISSMDHDGYTDSSDAYRGDLAWENERSSSEDSGADTDESVDEATDDLSFPSADDDDGEEQSDVTYDDLAGPWQKFIDNIHNAEGIDIDEYDIEAAATDFEDKNEPVIFDNVTAEDIATIAREEA